jgi:hypothetical protein
MAWSDINYERAEWLIQETKNSDSQTIVLIPQLLYHFPKIIERMTKGFSGSGIRSILEGGTINLFLIGHKVSTIIQ